jgi:hypothetical protein
MVFMNGVSGSTGKSGFSSNIGWLRVLLEGP